MKKIAIFALVLVMIFAFGAGVSAAPPYAFDVNTVDFNDEAGTNYAGAITGGSLDALAWDAGTLIPYIHAEKANGILLDITAAGNVYKDATISVNGAAAVNWYDYAEADVYTTVEGIFLPLKANTEATVVINWAVDNAGAPGGTESTTIKITPQNYTQNMAGVQLKSVSKLSVPTVADLTTMLEDLFGFTAPTSTLAATYLNNYVTALNAAITSATINEDGVVVIVADEAKLAAADGILASADGLLGIGFPSEMIPLIYEYNVQQEIKTFYAGTSVAEEAPLLALFGVDPSKGQIIVAPGFDYDGTDAFEETYTAEAVDAENNLLDSYQALTVTTWLNPVKVTFNTAGGTAVDPVVIAKNGTVLEAPETTKEGSYLDATVPWYISSGGYGGTPFDFGDAATGTQVTADATVTANWANPTAIKVDAAAFGTDPSRTNDGNNFTARITVAENVVTFNAKATNLPTTNIDDTSDYYGQQDYLAQITLSGATIAAGTDAYIPELDQYVTFSAANIVDVVLDAALAEQVLTLQIINSMSDLPNGDSKVEFDTDIAPLTFTVKVAGNTTPAFVVNNVSKPAKMPEYTAAGADADLDAMIDAVTGGNPSETVRAQVAAELASNLEGLTVTYKDGQVIVKGDFPDNNQWFPLLVNMANDPNAQIIITDADGNAVNYFESATPATWGATSIYDNIFMIDGSAKSPLTIKVFSDSTLPTELTVYVNEEPPVEDEFPFTDVKESDWFYDAVYWAWENNVTNGYTETLFAPERSLKRAEYITLLGRYLEIDVSGYSATTTSFNDVDAANYGYAIPYINWGVEKGIIKGYSATAFGPGDDTLRQDAAVMYYRYVDLVLGDGLTGDWAIDLSYFKDLEDLEEYATEAVTYMIINKLMVGHDDGNGNIDRFGFNDKLLRSEGVQVLYNFEFAS